MKRFFIFPGQGTPIGKEIIDIYHMFFSFREVLEEVDHVLNRNFSKVILSEDKSRLMDTRNSQIAIMSVSIGILRVILQETKKTFKDLCHVSAGHSLGEYSALCAAGVFSLKDTISLLKLRSEHMAKATGGKMVALLGIEKFDKESILKHKCTIANNNSSSQIVISGLAEDVDSYVKNAEKYGVRRCIPLLVSGAFHSEYMKNASSVMRKAISEIETRDFLVPVVKNITGTPYENLGEIPLVLSKQMVNCVRWKETVEYVIKRYEGIEVVECGSGNVLSKMLKREYESIVVYPSSTIKVLDDLFQIL